MTDLQEMKYHELKALAANKGVSGAGTKAELIERIEAAEGQPEADTVQPAIEPKREAPPPKPPEMLVTNADPQIIELAQVDAKLASIAEHEKHRARGQSMATRCNLIFAGRATAVYNSNNPTCVEFHGGARERQDILLAQPDGKIEQAARRYVTPAASRNTVGNFGER